MQDLLDEIARVQETSEQLLSHDDVQVAIGRIARELHERVQDSNPVVLCVMTGGLFFTSELLRRMNFLHQLDYVHASRYRGELTGRNIVWHARPMTELRDRTVVVLDDILDEGYTLDAIIKDCYSCGAAEVISAVLVEKQQARRCDIKADYVGLVVPNRYVFGYGMDYKGYLRNTMGIYAAGE
jgi:hypoxanthine phosphoribosyltransferase